MGVTLERVQFKFASIIGELCSEPDVLSQFAVWVDLRLAEYKLKGSISLDCSGETPDPVWLKGIKSALLGKELALRSQERVQSYNRRKAPPVPLKNTLGRSSTVTRDSSDTGLPFNNKSTSGSESPIFVTDDSDYVYPISLHTHDTVSHKHTIISPDSDQPSQSKRKRFMDNTDDDGPANESLMSIIGLNENQDKSDSAAQHSDSVQIDTDLLMGEKLNDTSELASSIPSTSSALHGSSRLSQADNQNDGVAQKVDSTQGYGYSGQGFQRQRLNQRAGRLGNIERRMRSRINTFESCLQGEPHRDFRPMEEIPPVQLDKYLAGFFLTVKTLSGKDFTINSFHSLKNSLVRYLNLKGYPHSFANSPYFAESRAAWKQKLFSRKLSTGAQASRELPAGEEIDDMAHQSFNIINISRVTACWKR